VIGNWCTYVAEQRRNFVARLHRDVPIGRSVFKYRVSAVLQTKRVVIRRASLDGGKFRSARTVTDIASERVLTGSRDSQRGDCPEETRETAAAVRPRFILFRVTGCLENSVDSRARACG